MIKCVFAVALLLSAFATRAEDLQRITVSGYRMEGSSEISKFSSLPGLSVNPESGVVYSNSVFEAQNQLVLTAKIPFGYRLSHWVKAYDDPFSRTKGEIVAGSEGRTELTVLYDANGTFMYLAPVIVVDNDRTVTIAKSPFGEGTVGTNLGHYASQKGDVFKLAAIPASDEKTGFDHSTFRRWEDGSTNYKRDAVVNSNDTFRAEFVPNSWTVTFDANGGEVFPTSKVVTCDAAYGWLPTPVLTGSEFLGWKFAQSSGGFVNKETKVGALGPHTLRAQWEKFRCQIDGLVDKASLNRGIVRGGGEYAYGSTATLTAEPDEGSQFVRWTDGLVNPLRRILVVSNASYTAEFEVARHDVTFTYRDSSGNLVTTAPTNVTYGAAAIAPDKSVCDVWHGHTFKNWNTEEYQKVIRNLSVVAIYDDETYSVCFVYRDLQGNCVTTMPQHVKSGLAATPPSASVYDNWEGMTFRGWQPDYSVIRNDVVIEALYKTNEYVITFCYNNEKGEEVQHSETVLHDELIPFDWVKGMVNLWKDHEFKYWSMDGKPVAEGAVATRAGKIVAVYEGYSTIVFDPGEGGSGEMPKQSFTNFTGTAELAKNVFERTGYEFAGWLQQTESVTNYYADGDSIHVVEGENISLTAQWKPIAYTIKLDANGGEWANGQPSVEALYDDPKPTTFVISRPEDGDLVTRVGYTLLPYWSREATTTNELYWMSKDGPSRNLVVSNLTTVAGETVTLYAQWQGTNLTVTINGKSQTIAYGSELEQPADPEPKTGYAFAGGWTTNGVEVTFPITVTGWFNLAPIWTTNTYSVAFHGTDGTYETQGTMELQMFTYDAAQKLLTNCFARTGYAFMNWTNATGTAFADGAVVKNLATNDGAIVDLYATWDDRRSYTVRFNPKNGDGTPYLQVMRCGKPTELFDNQFALTGYGFAGWGDGGDTVVYTNGQTVTDLVAENETNDLYAVWTPNRYWVAFDGNGADGGETMAPQAFTYDAAQALTSNAFTRTGYAFAGWVDGEDAVATRYADGAVVSNLTVEAEATNTLFAVWAVKSYEIRFDSAGGSAVAPMTNEFGKAVSAPANPTKTGYTFVEWRLNGAKFDFGTATMPAEDITLVAEWEENGHYTVRFNGNGGTNAVGQTYYEQLFTNEVGGVLRPNEFVYKGHGFVGSWTNVTGDVCADGAMVTNLTTGGATLDLYANWTANVHKVEWKDVITWPSKEYGTDLTTNNVSTPAKTGYEFAGWKWKGAVVENWPVSMPDEDVTFVADWNPITYTIAFDGNGADPGTSMGSTNVAYDQEIELPSNRFVRTGYKFEKWTNAVGRVYHDGDSVSNLTTAAGETVTLFANWIESGNPLSLALGLPGRFNVSVAKENAWTPVGDGNGLQRVSASESGGTLLIEIPAAGTLTYWFDCGEAAGNWLSCTFNSVELVRDKDNQYVKVRNGSGSRCLHFDGKGPLAFEGTPDDGGVWKLYDFKWVAD